MNKWEYFRNLLSPLLGILLSKTKISTFMKAVIRIKHFLKHSLSEPLNKAWAQLHNFYYSEISKIDGEFCYEIEAFLIVWLCYCGSYYDLTVYQTNPMRWIEFSSIVKGFKPKSFDWGCETISRNERKKNSAFVIFD